MTLVAHEHAPAVFASSFGAEDMVLLDLIARYRLAIEVFTLDTGRLPEETHYLIEVARLRYHLPIRVLHPDAQRLERFTFAQGENAFYRSIELRRRCCEIRKIEPLRLALAGKRAWITGLRRGQGLTRAGIEPLHWDESNGLMKANPLVDWNEGEVWAYLRYREVPYNALHDRGYPSIGCAPCTRAVPVGADARSGRWWWEAPESKECGLHVGSDGKLAHRTGATAVTASFA
jgi:phosphoadenosine phosphosulfate reductase